MSKGPEANFWNTIRQNLPPKASATRIENVHGGGVPDVHVIWDGLPFWIELKTTKSNAVSLRSHQVAWNMQYWSRGGACFFLVKSLSDRSLHLFGGDQGPCLMEKGLKCGVGHVFGDVGAVFTALRPRLLNHYSNVCAPAP